MSFDQVFESIAQKNTEVVINNTWGHLFPDKFWYEGSIVIAMSLYDGLVILNEDINIDGSPWWYNAIHDFIETNFHDLDNDNICEIKIVVNILNEKDNTLKIVINEIDREYIDYT